MARVTSKLQVTIPKAIAEQYGIEVGDELEFVPAGEAIRVIRPGSAKEGQSAEERLAAFDAATVRQRQRDRTIASGRKKARRGWTREELYRGRAG